MLPSTGYFKTINCPFYDSGSCDRPYCHFKHARREDAGNTAGMAGVVEAQASGQAQEDKSIDVVASNPDMLQHLVTEAVKKVLADQEVTDTEKVSQNIVSQVVEGLKPTLSSGSAAPMRNASDIVGKHIAIPTPITKPVACVYNPTPIAELKKRHIPVVSYMPTRESRVAVKRKFSPERVKPWLNIIQESSSSQSSEVTYKPTAIVNSTDQDTVQSYIPTVKSDSSSSNSYDDSNSNDYQSKFKEVYYPKSKKRREEYVPKNVKAPLKTVQQLNPSTLDQYEPEFDMIDEIFTADHIASNVLEQVKTSASEDSQDYSLDIEPKFSDDESIEDISNNEHNASIKKAEQIEDVNEKEKENLQHARADIVDKQTSNKDKKMHNNHYDIKTDVIKSSDKSKHKASDTSKLSQRREESTKESTDKEKEKHKSHSKSKKRDRKDHHSSERRDKERSRHESDSRDRHRSSNRDKDRKKSNRDNKDSSRQSRDHSDSRKHRHSPKTDRNNHHKSSRHDKHKSRSNSSSSISNKHTSSRSNKKHLESSDSSRKSRKYKENSERNSSDSSDSPAGSIHSFMDEEILELSDSDHDVQEECLRIFQEYQASDHPKLVSVKKSLKDETEDVEEVGKKRVAHPSAATSITRQLGPSQPPKKLITPQQKMYERWRLMREVAIGKTAEKATAEVKTQVTSMSAVQSSSNLQKEHIESASSTNNSDLQSTVNGRVRIAHVPYAHSLAMEKKKVAVTAGKCGDHKEVNNKTIAQTTKGSVRVAHIPQIVPQLVRPEPLQVATQKFPLNVRQYYINIMHDICVQIYTNSDDAAQRAVKEEFTCHEKCKALAVYKSSCMLAIHRLRKEVDQNKSNEKSIGLNYGMVSHEAMLAGKSKGSWSIVKSKKNVVDFKGPALYNMLKKWIMSEEQLRDNGFPRRHPDGTKGRAKVYVINTRNQSVLSKVPNERICSRCGEAYMVDKQGFAIQQQNCIYHWGRKFTIKGEGKYSCCQQYGSATGCCDAKTHVWDYTDYENLRGYVRTLSKDVSMDEQGVYALDCEMCYTTHGLELTRVTVIDEDCNVIYETLVKPQNPIIDYNTRFSGITEEDMKDVTTTILDVQATLLTMFSDKTILVGHSLESDFKALRLLHDTVVDTSVMFPHKNGYPQKRALKNLCSEYLRKIIQNDIGGHDSKEDAVACMELIRWKVKEAAKLQ
ncbi:RNA exonuclease 1 homolog [Cataglyphis hispanica]|uniref:RNA exonuclease 1 homolog n=1 Tax=Cataglyphis hispanica TaxID=1086592 RepID=UPI002180075B|nr:RNA exonuclease 1 homolog [Cataglyphis hispanica]